MILDGAAVVIPQDNVDTDVLYPGAYLNIFEAEAMKPYLFEGLDPSLRDQLGQPTVLFVGENFGCGSSREHVPQAIRAWGIQCVVGKSFARIFYRNCINLGLPAIVCPAAVEAARRGDAAQIDTDLGTVEVAGRRYQASPIPPFMHDMLSAGGLVPWARQQLGG